MKPGKIDIINKKVSESLDLDLELVKAINISFWDKTKEAINNLENTELYLNTLGSFKIKDWRVRPMIKYYTIALNSLEEQGKGGLEYLQYTEALDRFNKINTILEKVIVKENKKLKIKDEYIQNLEEQG